MELIKTVSEMQELASRWSGNVGFVPTMGFLHKGHLSLVKESVKHNSITVVSIYVNPSQFSPNEDLDSYPRDLERDIDLLKSEGVDYVFFPTNQEMYPDGYLTWVEVEEISSILCGKSRSTHFKGVTTIVTKLMNLVHPTSVYMGEKDFQQLTIIKKMVMDLNMPFNIVGCPLIREADGLAMSSRNRYLSKQGRENATALYKSLYFAKDQLSKDDDSERLSEQMSAIISKAGGEVEYIEFIDPETLKSVKKLHKGVRALLAVRIENTRLIDNMEL